MPKDQMPDDLREETESLSSAPGRPEVVNYERAKEAGQIEENLLENIEPSQERIIVELAKDFADYFAKLSLRDQDRILDKLAKSSEESPQKRLEFAKALALEILSELEEAKARRLNPEYAKENPSALANTQVSQRASKIRFHGRPEGTYLVGEDSEGTARTNRNRSRDSRHNFGRKPKYKDHK